MGKPIVHILAYCLLPGIAGTLFGGVRCVEGHIYAVAAEHEASTVGRVAGMLRGKGGAAYHFVFSLNGVERDDSSKNCATPLAPGACDNNGPVLVYYSFQPFQNPLLEDFAVASHRTYRTGKPGLGIGLPLLVLSCAGFVIRSRIDNAKATPAGP